MFYLFLALSLLTFLLFGFDKNAARTNQWRVPEKVARAEHSGRRCRRIAGHAHLPAQTRKNYFWVVLIASACAHLFLLRLSSPSCLPARHIPPDDANG
jgi:uncharacterized membrane protein YsdA (DUF1294 family)